MATTAQDPLPSVDWSYFNEPVPWQNHKSSILAISIAAMSLSALCVITRLYIRFRVIRSPGWDDLFVGLYLITNTASAIAMCIAPDSGLGQHIFYLTPQQLQKFLILFYISNSSYISSTTFVKLSLLFQYLRIYEHGTAYRYFCVFLIGLIGLWGSLFSFMAWVPCFPVSHYWEELDARYKNCYGFGISTDRTTFVIHTAMNMLFDFHVLAIPLPLYFKGGTPLKTRIGMTALLLLGVLVNAVAAVRLAILIKQKESIAQVIDATWFAPDAILLATVEGSLASICASVPIFWPILVKHIGNILVTQEIQIVHEERCVVEDKDDRYKMDAARCHYRDSFILGQVDPLRAHTRARVETRCNGN